MVRAQRSSIVRAQENSRCSHIHACDRLVVAVQETIASYKNRELDSCREALLDENKQLRIENNNIPVLQNEVEDLKKRLAALQGGGGSDVAVGANSQRVQALEVSLRSLSTYVSCRSVGSRTSYVGRRRTRVSSARSRGSSSRCTISSKTTASSQLAGGQSVSTAPAAVRQAITSPATPLDPPTKQPSRRPTRWPGSPTRP